VTRSEYGERDVRACFSVLLEIVRALGEHRDHMVLVGGWVPRFLFSAASEPHVGSLDIDLALDFRNITKASYETILATLMIRGYVQDTEQPFRFFRTVADAGGSEMRVEVDLLAGEYGGTGKKRRTQSIQDIQARKARGCDLAFESCVSVPIEGKLPCGGSDRASLRIAGIVPFLVMKGMAIHDRLKEKDAYDIFYCLEQFPGGPADLAREFKPFLENRLVREGLAKISDKFASVDHFGPRAVADFLEISDKEERAIIARRAFEQIDALFEGLGIERGETR